MTNVLLIIIAVLLIVRIVLQVRRGKRVVEKGYAAPSEVETTMRIADNDPFAINNMADSMARSNWELVTVIKTTVSGSPAYALFFTRKKIKNYYEE